MKKNHCKFFQYASTKDRVVPTDASQNTETAEPTPAPLEYLEKRFSFYPCLTQHDKTLYSLALERLSNETLSLEKPPAATKKAASSKGDSGKQQKKLTLARMVEAGIKIGTLPTVFHKIVDTVNSPFSSVQDIAAIIATDTSLSAKLLRLVNSPFYGLPNRIDTIPRAVALVGNGPLVMLTMGTVLVSAFSGIPSSLINMKEFWQHSISTGACAKMLARHAELEETESFFVAGLLHDIGRLIFFLEAPDSAFGVLSRSRKSGIPMRDIERELLGFTHEEIGAELLKEWHCPPQLIDYVQNHHATIPGKPMPYEVILPVADSIVSALGHGSSGEIFISPVSQEAWETLRLEPDDLRGIAQSIEENLVGLSQMFC